MGNTLRSCDELASYGITASGTYQIDPDGELIGDAPIEVYCNFTDGSTQLLHDYDLVTVEIDPCPTKNCYELDISYNASWKQIDALKSISEECFQEISFDCFLSGLSNLDGPIGSWLDVAGDPQIYFVGQNYGSHLCSCALDESCSESAHNYKCNCDAQIPELQNDNGFITNMT